MKIREQGRDGHWAFPWNKTLSWNIAKSLPHSDKDRIGLNWAGECGVLNMYQCMCIYIVGTKAYLYVVSIAECNLWRVSHKSAGVLTTSSCKVIASGYGLSTIRVFEDIINFGWTAKNFEDCIEWSVCTM